MLRKLVATTLILSAMSVVAPAQASSTRDIGESLCAYVQSDNKSGIRKVLRQRNVKIRSIFDDLRCNGKDLLSFADHNGAEDAGALIIKRLPKDTASELKGTLKTPALIAELEARIG